MNDFAKLDVAIEVMASEISKTVIQYEKTREQQYLKHLEELHRQRNQIYSGNIETINKMLQ